MRMTIPRSMSWRSVFFGAWLTAVAAGPVGAGDAESIPSALSLRERAIELDRRAADVAAHEQRLTLWEHQLTRRAEGEGAHLDVTVTSRELLRAILTTSFVSVLMTLILLRMLERQGVWRPGRTRARTELRGLESRLMGGLREVDQVLTRVVDRFYKDVTGRKAVDGHGEVAARRRAAGRSGYAADRPAPAPGEGIPGSLDVPEGASLRQRVLGLARQGRSLEDISQALGLGPAEIAFILRTAVGR